MAINTVDVTKTQKGPSMVYTGLAVPAADAEVTLVSGVPDATENPNCKLIGLSENGATCSITKTETEEFFDEYKEPLIRTVDQVKMSIKVDACQILDIDVLSAATVGVGTPQTVSGKKKIQIGEGVVSDTGIAVIAPTRANSAKYAVFHIYSGHNMSNVEFALSRQARSKMSLDFVGVGIASRAAVDRIGAMWWQT